MELCCSGSYTQSRFRSNQRSIGRQDDSARSSHGLPRKGLMTPSLPRAPFLEGVAAAPILPGFEGESVVPDGSWRSPTHSAAVPSITRLRKQPPQSSTGLYLPRNQGRARVIDFESPWETSTCLALLLLSLFCLLFPRGGSGLRGLQRGFSALLGREGFRTCQAAFLANFNHRLSEGFSIHVQILHRSVHGGKTDLVLCLTP